MQGRGLDALAGFPEPGFDLDEIAAAPNIEIHFVDSSGIIGWNFLGAAADFEFHDWNFSDREANSTAADYRWLVDRVHRAGHGVYVADFSHLGVYACRILVPGMSEIYPLDDLQWENNSVGNAIRAAVLRLPQLDDAESAALRHLYGAAALATVEAMLRQEQRCFGIAAPGLELAGCELHRQLLVAYDKLPH